jgi:hypothetical protein
MQASFSLMAKDVVGKLIETGYSGRQDISNNVMLPCQSPTSWLRPLIIVSNQAFEMVPSFRRSFLRFEMVPFRDLK